jgi:hypothetical protein
VLPLGPNGYGEYLQPGRVTDCYLGILLDQPLAQIMTETRSVLVVAPAALRHREILQPHGWVLHNLVTGHPERGPQDLVFLADLTVELLGRIRSDRVLRLPRPPKAGQAARDQWPPTQARSRVRPGQAQHLARAAAHHDYRHHPLRHRKGQQLGPAAPTAHPPYLLD